MQNDNTTPEVPVAGIIYGRIVYWLVSLGIVVALVGSIICMTFTGNPNSAGILGGLWNGDNIHVLWDECAGLQEPLHGYWYLSLADWGDRIAMLGIAVSCIASVVGMWGASVTMLRTRVPRRTLYFILAIIVSVVLTLSAMGVISLEH